MPPLVVIAGPTAVGKSALALELAERLDGEIVSADALQAYRGLDIGTAKPSAEEQARLPHHLIDILEPHERYSAGEFARRARQAIAAIEARGRLPLVVGGSGLYLRALTEGISPVPPGDPAVRRALRQRLASEGLDSLVAELERRDPETARRLAPGDTQRVLRALEVVEVSGEPLAVWIARQPFGEGGLPSIKLALTLPRQILYDLISRRAARMLAQGWIDEVKSLLDRGVRADVPAFQAIGYRQIVRHLGGELTREQAQEEIVRATRRFAKRQLTWFRKERGVIWMDSAGAGHRIDEAMKILARSGIGGA